MVTWIYATILSRTDISQKHIKPIKLSTTWFKRCYYITHFQNAGFKEWGGKLNCSIGFTSAAVPFGHETLRKENSGVSSGLNNCSIHKWNLWLITSTCKANTTVKRNYFRGIILPASVQELIHAKTNHRISGLVIGVIKSSLTWERL